MSQPYVGEIRIFGGNFAPVGWMFCDGQLLPISEYGSTTVTLLSSDMPAHTHTINCIDGGRIGGQVGQPGNAILTKTSGTPPLAYASGGAQNQQLAQNAVSAVGGGQPHNNMMPYLTLNFCIAMQGIFPPRS